jgi:hypothetical protein
LIRGPDDFHIPSWVIRHIAPVNFQLRLSSAASAASPRFFDIRMQTYPRPPDQG